MNLLDAILAKAIAGASGTTDYSSLENKPKINNVTLQGNKTAANLGLQTTLTYDEEPTENSNKLVKSGDLYTYFQNQFVPTPWTRFFESIEIFYKESDDSIRLSWEPFAYDGFLKFVLKEGDMDLDIIDDSKPVAITLFISILSPSDTPETDDNDEIISQYSYDKYDILDAVLYVNSTDIVNYPNTVSFSLPVFYGQRIEIHMLVDDSNLNELPEIDENFLDYYDSYVTYYRQRDYSNRIAVYDYHPFWIDDEDDDD